MSRTACSLMAVACLSLSISCSDGETVSTELATLTELEHGCVVSAACGIQARARVSNCVDYYYDVLVGLGLGPLYTDIYRCVAAAGDDCLAVQRCYGQTGSCSQSFTAYCDGNTAYTCDLLDQKVYALKCSVAGLKCVPKPAEPFAAECHCQPGFKTCHGDFALSCVNGQPESIDCRTLNAKCVNGACEGTEPKKCNLQETPASCEGSIAVRCNQDGILEQEDCSKRTFKTRCKDGSCQRSSDECADEFNECTPSGDLKACIDGKWKTFPCASLGLGDCRAATYGANCARFN